MSDAKEFAEFVQALLEPPPKGRGLKRSTIAAYAGVAHTTVMDWLRGSQPKPHTLEKLARALGVDYADLMRLAGYPVNVVVRSAPMGAVISVPPATVRTDPVTQPDTEHSFSSDTLRLSPEEAIAELARLAMAGQVRRVRVQDSWVHAGHEGVDGDWTFVPPEITSDEVMAFRVHGECLQPFIRPYDVVLCDAGDPPVDGDVVVVNLDGQVLVRLLDAKNRQLVATNGEPPLGVDDVRAFVKVVSITKSPRIVRDGANGK